MKEIKNRNRKEEEEMISLLKREKNRDCDRLFHGRMLFEN